MSNGEKKPWHRGTRWWKLAGETLFLSYAALFVSIGWRPDAIGLLTGLCATNLTLVFGGAAVVKHKQTPNGGLPPTP